MAKSLSISSGINTLSGSESGRLSQEDHTFSYTTLPDHFNWQPAPLPTSRVEKKKSSLKRLTSFVKDPQRLSTADERREVINSPTLIRTAGKSVSQETEFDIDYNPLIYHQQTSIDAWPSRSKSTTHLQANRKRMVKKRPSLQTVLTVPSLLQTPLLNNKSPLASPKTTGDGEYYGDYFSRGIGAESPSRPSSGVTSPRESPPPAYLLDDDPFANLNGAPYESTLPPVPLSPPRLFDAVSSTPRSATFTPTSSPPPSSWSEKSRTAILPVTPPSASSIIHARHKSFSGGRVQPIPARQRPAFAPKPSLPSLATLSQMNVVLTKKVRKGRVGAGLPFEPWDNPEGIALPNSSGGSPGSSSPQPIAPMSSNSSVPDSPERPNLIDATGDVERPPPPPPLQESKVTTAVEAVNVADKESNDTVNVDSDSTGTVVPISMPSMPSSHDQASSDVTVNGRVVSYPGDTESIIDFSSVPALSPSRSTEYSYASLSRSTSTSSSGSSLDYYSDDQQHFTSRISSSGGRYGNGNGDPTNRSSADSGSASLLNSSGEDYFSLLPSYSNWQPGDDDDNDDDNDEDNQSALPLTSPPLSTCLDYLHDSQVMYQPGSSAETVRPTAPFPQAASYVKYRRTAPHQDLADAIGYGGGYDTGSNATGLAYNQSSGGRVYNSSESNGWDHVRRSAGGPSSGRGADDDHSRHRRPLTSTTISSSSDISSDDGDFAGGDKNIMTPFKNAESDDDVPLAKRIPTALVAQKSIRRQVREERAQRKREEATRPEAIGRQPTLRPAGAGAASAVSVVVAPPVLSSSQEAALHASRPITSRPRTQTLPSRVKSPLSADELTRKLQDVQVATTITTTSTTTSSSPRVSAHSTTTTTSRISGETERSEIDSPRSLRPSRSFYRPQDHKAVPLPSDAERKLSRARSRSCVRDDPRKPSFEEANRVPMPMVTEGYHRKLAPKPFPEARSTRQSLEGERPSNAPVPHRPPVPAIPPEVVNRQVTQQQRFFIGDMQRYNVVEITDTTSAGDVIEILQAQGVLKGWGDGEWMVWEMSHDFGMERPIRHFERLSDVQASWNKDKMVNAFVVRLTPLAPLLSRSAIPSSSPTYAGYVEYESKRGKWSKRWLQLREHSLWMSKRDNGKDEVLLCSLSNFDAYHISRLYKAPKPFVFAVKSTDKLSFFENASDYLHVISCSEKEGKNWMEKILLARSYVLHQERNVLFNPRSYGVSPSGASGPLSRSNTRKKPAKPLVNVDNQDIFEPGSLLRR